MGGLSQTSLLGWDVTPLLDDGLLDLPWVGSGSGADLLGDIDTLLLGLEEGDQLGDVLARSLGLQVTVFLWDLLDDGFLLVEALLWSGGKKTARWTAKFSWDLLTLGFGAELGDLLLLGLTFLTGPLGTLLFSGVTLGDILALLVLDGVTDNNIIFNIVLVVSGLAQAFVDSLTFLWALTGTDEWSVTELDLLIEGDLLVFDETVLDEVLLALFFLLGLEVGGVGGVTTGSVTVLTFDDVIVFGLFNHYDLVDTTLTSGSNGTNVESKIVSLSTLTGITGWESNSGGSVVLIVVVFMLMSVIVTSGTSGTSSVASIEWEGVS
jgi:hypothetical protein